MQPARDRHRCRQGTSSIRSATGLVLRAAAGPIALAFIQVGVLAGRGQAKMIEEVKLKDEVEVPPKPACIVM